MAVTRTTKLLGICAAAALGAAAAIRLWPSAATADVAASHLPVTVRWHESDTLDAGETLSAVLQRHHLTRDDASAALAVANGLDDRRVPAGLVVQLDGDRTAGVTAPASAVALLLSPERVLHLTRRDARWVAEEERIPWVMDTIVAHGVVHANLYEAIDGAAGTLLSKEARAELAWAIADVYEYRIDMSRELQDGDRVRVVFERERSPKGGTRVGDVIAAGVERGGKELQAYRFVPRGASHAEYFDATGHSLRAAFLRAPLSFRRISSVFGMRKHPILGKWRAHKGTDYAANAGTPVRSIGDGTVIFAGVKNGFGNTIEVRHPNGFVTRYGHLRGFAAGVRRGLRVQMGKTIGYVGMTGLATAPHLHFEVLVHGVQRDPRTALKASQGMLLARADQPAFVRSQRIAEAELERPAGNLRSVAGSP